MTTGVAEQPAPEAEEHRLTALEAATASRPEWFPGRVEVGNGRLNPQWPAGR